MAPAELLDEVVERSTLAEHAGRSGAALERVRLTDGRRLFVKRVTPESDLTLSCVGGTVAQEYLLWRSGALDRLPAGVGHALVDGWVEGDTTVIVMRDLGDTVLGWDRTLTVAECRWVLDRITRMHATFAGDPPAEVVPLAPVLEIFAPARIAGPAADGDELLAAATRGWEYFADPALVPPDVATAVFGTLADSRPLVAALEALPTTLAHGDLATVNMAFEGDDLLLLDWALPAAAPGAVDVARFLVGCAHVVEPDEEQFLALYREAAGTAYDEEAVHVGLFAALCWLGWNKTLDIVESRDRAVRERERASLAWWVDKARTALESGAL